MGHRSSHLIVAALVLLAAGCGGDTDGSEGTTPVASTIAAPVTTEPTPVSGASDPPTTEALAPTTTTIDDGATAVDQVCHDGSSPSSYDPAGGAYATRLIAIDGDTVTFDVIQWLVGADAVAAHDEAEPGDTGGPPNDFWVLNENPTTYEAAVIDTVPVRLVRLAEDDDADLDAGTFAELPTYLAGYRPAPDDASLFNDALSYNPFWLTIADGRITDICEQYTP